MNNKWISIIIAACAVLLAGSVVAISLSMNHLATELRAFTEETDERFSALSNRLDELEAAGSSLEQVNRETVLAAIDGEAITYGQVYDSFQEIAYLYEDLMDINDQSTLNDLLLEQVNSLVEETVLTRMAEAMSLMPSDETVKLEAESQYNEVFEYYYEEYISAGEPEASAKEQTEELMAEYGMALEDLEASARYDLTLEAVREEAAAQLIGERTEESYLTEAFDQYVAEAKARYEEEPFNFEFELYYFDTPIYYIPEGYRAAKHVLILFDDSVQEEAAALFNELEEETTDESRRQELLAQIEALKEPYAEKIEEIASAIDAGTDFDELIGLYGEDPGMYEGDTKQNGYYVSAASDFWESAFQDVAMALSEPGDVSEPVVSSVGIHFIKYLRDVESGPVSFETVRDAMIAEITQEAKEEAYLEVYNEWCEKLGVEVFEDVLKTSEGNAQGDE